jgi:penicillin-binding protein 2
MRIKSGRRITWLGAVILLLLSSLGGRLYQLQIVNGPDYARRAFRQRTLSLPVASQRGMILDRNGVPLTDPRNSWGVALFPPLLQDASAEARALAPLLSLPEGEVSPLLAAPQRPTWLKPGVTATTAARIQELGLPGIAAGARGERYGADALARHLVGYVNDDGGQLGLERAFNQALAGDAVPSLTAYLDGTGKPIAGLGIRTVLPQTGKEPYALHTTIDSKVQRGVESVLNAHPELRGAVVVMDPTTGELLAMASRPQFDYTTLGDLLGQGQSGSFLLNRAVTGYPPGSVFKAVIAAAALDSGKVSLDEKFFCPGHYDVDGHRFTEPGGGHGWITFREAVAKSCNITFLKVGVERLGIPAMREAALRFGFGSPTEALGQDTPWPEEQAGDVPGPLDDGALQMAFGQGALEVTPLQVARAFSAIANGGTLPPVRLITAVKAPDGEVKAIPRAAQPVRVISDEAATLLQMALVAVTDPRGAGTGRQAWIDGVGTAGKTGSAEGVDQKGARAIHAWFAGYLPAGAPRYVIVVMAEGGGAGGAVAAPIFREVGQAILAESR